MRPAPPPECGLVASAATTQPLQPPRSTPARGGRPREIGPGGAAISDRKSTRLNSSHSQISYAVFCWKKKKICGSVITRRTLPDTHCWYRQRFQSYRHSDSVDYVNDGILDIGLSFTKTKPLLRREARR